MRSAQPTTGGARRPTSLTRGVTETALVGQWFAEQRPTSFGETERPRPYRRRYRQRATVSSP